jgi:hypothetical protein
VRYISPAWTQFPHSLLVGSVCSICIVQKHAILKWVIHFN